VCVDVAESKTNASLQNRFFFVLVVIMCVRLRVTCYRTYYVSTEGLTSSFFLPTTYHLY